MPINLSRRAFLKESGLMVSGSALAPHLRLSGSAEVNISPPIRLSFNENPYGPSPAVATAIQCEFTRLNRYADAPAAQLLTEQIAAYEHIHPEQVVLGEVLNLLGRYLGSRGGPGGEFIYSNPGYLALIDAAAHVGGVAVPVPLNRHYENDLSALSANVNARTCAIYLVNPHNPTGTVNDDAKFKRFLRASSGQAVVIVDEAYLEYTPDFTARSAVSLVREGANVIVFRTFDKIHGLAGLPIGYVLAPKELVRALRKQGAGDAEALGRLNIVAASAALRDTAQVEHTRTAITRERALWLSILRELKLTHTETLSNFVFFDVGRPQPEFAAAMRSRGIDIGRDYPPFTNWARITIGLPEENLRTQTALRQVLKATT